MGVRMIMNEINGLPKLKIDIAGKSSTDMKTDMLTVLRV